MKRCRWSSTRSRRWRQTRRCCARTSRTRPTARMASASTTTISSPGRWATRARPMRPSSAPRSTIKELISYQRVHPSPLETCQCVASFDKVRGELTVWGTFQAPHVIRTVASLISKIPEHKIHVISPDIGGGFGNKVGAYPGYICAIVASIVTGRPVKWVEDRIENLSTTSFARDYHMTTEIAARRDGKVTGLARPRAGRPRRVRCLRRPVQMAGGLLQHRHRLLRLPGRPLRGRRRLYQQGAGRRRLSLLLPGDGGRLLHRAGDGHPRPEARHGPG